MFSSDQCQDLKWGKQIFKDLLLQLKLKSGARFQRSYSTSKWVDFPDFFPQVKLRRRPFAVLNTESDPGFPFPLADSRPPDPLAWNSWSPGGPGPWALRDSVGTAALCWSPRETPHARPSPWLFRGKECCSSPSTPCVLRAKAPDKVIEMSDSKASTVVIYTTIRPQALFKCSLFNFFPRLTLSCHCTAESVGGRNHAVSVGPW